ncbi:hypothetical protein HYW20_07805 [Candidatus Woesearchaeota archaeon]|nr:hypothetical protein [Candidatus Woesearchaeota archaeon]
MKKRKLLLFSMVLSLAIYKIILVYAQSGVGVGLYMLDTTAPSITLISPINNSGNPNGNATFAYNVTDSGTVDNCSLIINSKINMTDMSAAEDATVYFKLNNTQIIPYNWSVNCTDSSGNIGQSPERRFVTCYATHFDGATTNLSASDIRNVSHFIVESSSYGRINFSDNVSMEQCYDFDSFINISSNKIQLDSSALTSFNRSATLMLYGLGFSNPRILIDGQVCSSDACSRISYSGGTLVFNVTHFTAFSSEETPVAGGGGSSGGGGAASGGGGGAGGTAPPVETDFSVDKTNIRVALRQGETKKETLNIKNTGTSIFDLTANLNSLKEFLISPAESIITVPLNPSDEKSIELVFKAGENIKPDVYPGRIILKGPSVEKEVIVVVEVDSAQPLFDIDVDVLPDSKQAFPGQDILMEVNLFNVRGFGRVDVTVEFLIKSLDGEVLAAEEETLAVETQAKFTRALLVPSDLKPGTYVAFVKVNYGDSIGTSSDLFEVKAKTIKLYSVPIKDYGVILMIGAAIAILGIFAFSAYRLRYAKKEAPKTKEEEAHQLKEEGKAQKLGKELEALDKARKSGFISEESYQKDKERIQNKLSKLKKG